MSINKEQRKKLKALAHHLKVFVNIGKEGVNDGVLHSIRDKIDKDELIKIKFSKNKNEKEFFSKKIEKEIQAERISIIGNILILYKRSKNPQNKRIKI